MTAPHTWESRFGPGVGMLAKDLPKWRSESIDFYYWFWGSQLVFIQDGPGGKIWRKWNAALKEALLKNQNGAATGHKAGSWEPFSRWSREGGRVYTTAMGALVLEVYYRDLSLQR